MSHPYSDQLQASVENWTATEVERQTWADQSATYELETARTRAERSLTALDLTDIILDGDTAERMIAAMRAQNPNEVGRVMLSAVNAWLDRVAEREVYGAPLSRMPGDLMDAPWRLPKIQPARPGEEWS